MKKTKIGKSVSSYRAAWMDSNVDIDWRSIETKNPWCSETTELYGEQGFVSGFRLRVELAGKEQAIQGGDTQKRIQNQD